MLFAAPNFAAADVILLAPRYDSRVLARLPGFVGDLRVRGKRVMLVNNTAEFQSREGWPLFDWQKRQPAAEDEAASLNALAYLLQHETLAERNAQLADLARREDLPVLDRYGLLCDAVAQRCALVTPEGRKTLYDYGHWTLEGARLAGARAAQAGWAARMAPPVTAEGKALTR
jgi:hypothetical protein